MGSPARDNASCETDFMSTLTSVDERTTSQEPNRRDHGHLRFHWLSEDERPVPNLPSRRTCGPVKFPLNSDGGRVKNGTCIFPVIIKI